MPIDYSKYPKDWKSVIRPDILKRDGNCCKTCGVQNYSCGYRDKEGLFWKVSEIMKLLEDSGYDIFEEGNELDHIPPSKMPTKIVLTISHLDHNTSNNNYENLAALCQRCHLKYDNEHHKKSRKESGNKKKKLQTLF